MRKILISLSVVALAFTSFEYAYSGPISFLKSKLSKSEEQKIADSEKKASKEKAKRDAEKQDAFFKKVKEVKKDFEYLRTSIETAQKEIKKSNDSSDQHYGSVESKQKSAIVERILNTFIEIIKPVDRGIAEYTDSKSKKSANSEERQEQATNSVLTVLTLKAALAKDIADFVRVMREEENDMYNQENVAKAITKLKRAVVTGDGKNATGKDIMLDFEALTELADEINDENTKQFLSDAEPAIKMCSDVYTAILSNLIKLIVDVCDEKENDGTKLLDITAEKLELDRSLLDSMVTASGSQVSEEEGGEVSKKSEKSDTRKVEEEEIEGKEEIEESEESEEEEASDTEEEEKASNTEKKGSKASKSKKGLKTTAKVAEAAGKFKAKAKNKSKEEKSLKSKESEEDEKSKEDGKKKTSKKSLKAAAKAVQATKKLEKASEKKKADKPKAVESEDEDAEMFDEDE